MGKIILLDDSTINKIAAGEVVERPASVVKEIVENSIDAGATNISIEIKNGGISYIRVTDNGKGIMQDDMEIAFERHATSKLRSAEDLDEIKSMGFRGEALASIAAISKVEVISKTQDSDLGYKVVVEGGKILESEETGAQNGTTITVENLFYNTPVRYKFLKKDFTESGYIEDIVTKIALVHPEIAIKLINSGKTIVQTSGNGDIKAVIYGIYGKDVAENLIDVDYNYEDLNIKGVVGKPVISRSNRTNQIFFVNQRYVKDKTLLGAAEQAFKGFVTIGKHGFLILNVTMDPKKVDVNVHPTKLEVRFQDENGMFKAVYHAVRDALTNGDLVVSTSSIEGIDNNHLKNNEEIEETNKNVEDIKENISQEEKEKLEEETSTTFRDILTKMQTKSEEIVDNLEEKAQVLLQEDKIEENEGTDFIAQPLTEEQEEKDDEEIEETNIEIDRRLKKELSPKVPIEQPYEKPDDKTFLKMYESVFGSAIKKEEKDEDEFKPEAEEGSGELHEIKDEDKISLFEQDSEYIIKPAYKLIGIAFRTYIILEIKNDLYLLDQHAAHERVLYEKVKKNYFNNPERNSQLMLLPDVIELTNREMDIYRDNREMFEKAGFMIEEFGDTSLKLSGVPDILLDVDTKELFLETLDEINTVARTAKDEIEDRFLATVACKAAVKANMDLGKEEVEKLLDQLLALPNPFTCPHGRPTAIRMTRTDNVNRKISK